MARTAVRRTSSRLTPLLLATAAAAATLVWLGGAALRAAAFAGAPAGLRRDPAAKASAHAAAEYLTSRKAEAATATATKETKVEDAAPMTDAEKEKRALELWLELKPEVATMMDKQQTMRIDVFDKFMRQDARGKELFELYPPGSPEYTKFFEENMGPFLFDIAKGKMGEAGLQVIGVIAVFAAVVAFGGVFGDIFIKGVTTPLTGVATDVVSSTPYGSF